MAYDGRLMPLDSGLLDPPHPVSEHEKALCDRQSLCEVLGTWRRLMKLNRKAKGSGLIEDGRTNSVALCASLDDSLAIWNEPSG